MGLRQTERRSGCGCPFCAGKRDGRRRFGGTPQRHMAFRFCSGLSKYQLFPLLCCATMRNKIFTGVTGFMKCLEKLSEKQAKRITVVLLILGIALLACTAILTMGFGKGYEVTTYSMGSYVRQTVYGKEREEAARQAANAVAGLEDLISWRVEDSDIQKLNAQAGKEFIPIESQTWQILKLSLSVCEASGGAFDITIAP